LLGFLTTLPCFAQVADLLEKQTPGILLQTGIGMQWLGENYKLSTFSVEMPVRKFGHLGLQAYYYLPENQADEFVFGSKFSGGFEIGAFAKHFLHGKLSGRKSILYLGPEIRSGKLHHEDWFFGDFTPGLYTTKTEISNHKFLLRWGGQWLLGKHTVLEFAVPLGWQISKSRSITSNNGSEYRYSGPYFGKFIVAPTILIGVGF